jgi:hypothetical protein
VGKLFNYSVCLIILLINLGCSEEPSGPVIVAPTIADEYTLTPFEKLEPLKRTFGMRIESLQPFKGDSCMIDASGVNISGEVSVSIKGLRSSQNGCLPDQIFADDNLEIAELEIGVYDLNINLDNIVNNRGVLLVEFDKYSIDLETTNGIRLTHDELMRLPDNSIWGLFAYDDIAFEEVSQDFLSFFSDFDDENFPSGYYGNFIIDELGNLVLNNSLAGREYVKTFTFRNVFEMSLVQDVIMSFRDQYENNIDIKIFTSNGSEL